MASSISARRLSLRTKWALALLIMGALPLVVLASFALIKIQSDGLGTAERTNQNLRADQVAQIITEAAAAVADLTHDTARFLSDDRLTPPELRMQLSRERLQTASVLSAIAVYDKRGDLMGGVQRVENPAAPPTPAQADSAEFPERLNLPPDLAETGRWLPTEACEPVAKTSAAVKPQNIGCFLTPLIAHGEITGFALGKPSRTELARRLSSVISSDKRGQTHDLHVLDGSFTVLFAADLDQRMPVGSHQAGRDLFRVLPLPSGALQTPISLTADFVSERGVAMVGTVRSLPERQLLILISTPAQLAYGIMARVRQLLLLSTLGLAALCLLAGHWLASRTTRPVEQLVGLTRAYAQRDFQPRSRVQTGDELEELGNSLSTMAQSLQDSEREIARRAQVESALSRFLPDAVAKEIAADQASIRLGGERRKVAVLFADVTAFTTFTESAPPERVVAFLNDLFTVLTEVIFRHGGLVDKFIGDSVMSLFGVPHAQDDFVQRALAAAEDMHRFVEAYAPAWRDAYGIDAKIAIGLNCGEAVVGNLGTERRMEYTAIGDVVNVAARLESLAHPGQTLVTAAVVDQAGTQFDFREVGEHPLRGKRQQVRIYELK